MKEKIEFSEQDFDAELRELLKTQERVKLSDDFTKNVMHQIEGERHAQTYQPVISARVLIAVAVFIGIFAVLAVIQPGNSAEEFWTLHALSAFSFIEVMQQWQHNFSAVWPQQLVPSGIFLPLLGLMMALSIHYIFLSILSNKSNGKTKELYCL